MRKKPAARQAFFMDKEINNGTINNILININRVIY
jgi:hypothetical protein